MQRLVRGEVMSSTFDDRDRHVQVAMVIEEEPALGRREGRRDPARLDDHAACARVRHGSSRHGRSTGTAVFDASACSGRSARRRAQYRGRQFSSTMIATTLIDTGSRMDDMIYKEFKGTATWRSTWSARWPKRNIYVDRDVNRSGHAARSCSADILQKSILRNSSMPMNSSRPWNSCSTDQRRRTTRVARLDATWLDIFGIMMRHRQHWTSAFPHPWPQPSPRPRGEDSRRRVEAPLEM